MELTLNGNDHIIFLAKLSSGSNEGSLKNSDKSPVKIEDLRDIKRSLEGNDDAYKNLVNRYQNRIGRLMWRFSRDRNTHEELVQDVFVEAYFSLKNFKGKGTFFSWLSTIATRVGYSYWKELEKLKKKETFSLQDWDKTADSENSNELDNEMIYKILHKLPVKDRLVLTLRYLEDCDIKETAKRTGWSRSMVKVQAFRAKKKFKDLLAKAGVELKK